jgi:hypothetical protein
MKVAYSIAVLMIAVSTNAMPVSMSRQELAKFLGPVSPGLVTWEKNVREGSESYEGKANPPFSGTVSLTMFLPPWKPDLGEMPVIEGPDRLGVLSGTWSEGEHEGGYYDAFRFADRDGRFLYVDIQSPAQTDVERLKKEVSRLPMFNLSASSPFRALETRRRVSRLLAWVALPGLFLLSLWLSQRKLRKRQAPTLRRAFVFLAISAAWIPAFIGLIFVSQVFTTTQTIIPPPLAAHWWITPAMAASCLVGAILFILLILMTKSRGK